MVAEKVLSMSEAMRKTMVGLWGVFLVVWRKEELRSYRIELLEDIDSAHRKINRIEGELERRGLRYE